MTRQRDKANPPTALALLDSVLDSDDRTRRARSLMISGTFCGLVLLLGVGVTVSFGITGFVTSGVMAAVASVFTRRYLRRTSRGRGQ